MSTALKFRARRVCQVLAERGGRLTIAEICAQTELSRRTVIRALADLRAAGALTVVRRVGRPSDYQPGPVPLWHTLRRGSEAR